MITLICWLTFSFWYATTGALVGRKTYSCLYSGYKPSYGYDTALPDNEDKFNYMMAGLLSAILWPLSLVALIITYKPAMNDKQLALTAKREKEIQDRKIQDQATLIHDLERELRIGQNR